MPILKANEALPERPVVVAIYGDPGARKTSTANTADSPLLIDFDRGVARSWDRKDTLTPRNWEEVIEEEKKGLFKNYKTIIIDTAKAALDDFLMTYVVRMDYKLAKNKLQVYGAIGDEFKRFVAARREEGIDVLILAHAKKDEDTKKLIPDITGQSYQLVLRIADQLGYMTFKNNVPVLQWNPTDLTVGKNTANLPEIPVPDKSDAAFKGFMGGVIDQVKKAIVSMSEAQREALQKAEDYQKKIAKVKTPEQLTELITPIQGLPKALSQGLLKLVGEKGKAKGWTYNKKDAVWEGEVKEPEQKLAPETEEEETKEPAQAVDELPFN